MGGCKKALPWIGPALSICSVAKGRVDGFLDTGCSMEGQAAAAFILQKAGGQTRDLEGRGIPIVLLEGSSPMGRYGSDQEDVHNCRTDK
jgi:fructose-1,6-bisphosphatase/inositol monophosphatase family enzyme